MLLSPTQEDLDAVVSIQRIYRGFYRRQGPGAIADASTTVDASCINHKTSTLRVWDISLCNGASQAGTVTGTRVRLSVEGCHGSCSTSMQPHVASPCWPLDVFHLQDVSAAPCLTLEIYGANDVDVIAKRTIRLVDKDGRLNRLPLWTTADSRTTFTSSRLIGYTINLQFSIVGRLERAIRNVGRKQTAFGDLFHGAVVRGVSSTARVRARSCADAEAGILVVLGSDSPHKRRFSQLLAHALGGRELLTQQLVEAHCIEEGNGQCVVPIAKLSELVHNQLASSGVPSAPRYTVLSDFCQTKAEVEIFERREEVARVFVAFELPKYGIAPRRRDSISIRPAGPTSHEADGKREEATASGDGAPSEPGAKRASRSMLRSSIDKVKVINSFRRDMIQATVAGLFDASSRLVQLKPPALDAAATAEAAAGVATAEGHLPGGARNGSVSEGSHEGVTHMLVLEAIATLRARGSQAPGDTEAAAMLRTCSPLPTPSATAAAQTPPRLPAPAAEQPDASAAAAPALAAVEAAAPFPAAAAARAPAAASPRYSSASQPSPRGPWMEVMSGSAMSFLPTPYERFKLRRHLELQVGELHSAKRERLQLYQWQRRREEEQLREENKWRLANGYRVVSKPTPRPGSARASPPPPHRPSPQLSGHASPRAPGSATSRTMSRAAPTAAGQTKPMSHVLRPRWQEAPLFVLERRLQCLRYSM